MIAEKDYNIVNIMGVPKNGKSLLSSLLDNHEEVASFPLEIKFVDHYMNTLKNKKFDDILDFFLSKSKIYYLDKKSFQSDIGKKFLTDNIYSPEFNLNKYKEIIRENLKNFDKSNSVLKDIIVLLHNSLDIFFKRKTKKTIVIQDGCYGLRYIEEQKKIFQNTKFIIVVRNPLDVYCDLKKIREKFKRFRRNIHDICHVENLKTNVKNLNYFKLNEVYESYKNENNFFFIKYEELVNEPKKIMENLSSFLGIAYSDSLLQPTVLGKAWLDNSADFKRNKNISNDQVDKYKSVLNENEIIYITYFNQKFYKNFNYRNYVKNFKKLKILSIIFKIYIQNIIEVRLNIKRDKLYILKYLYFFVYSNNKFLLKSLNYFFFKT